MKRISLSGVAGAVSSATLELFMIVADKFYRTKYGALSRRLGLEAQAAKPDRGLIVVQIDALSHEHLQLALERGYAPYLKRLIEQGHGLGRYSSGLPSSTPAAQCGIMYGNNYNIPAFRWYEKLDRRSVTCKLPTHVARLEQEIGRGRRGILEGGSSYSNLISGGAARSLFTVSTFGQGSLLDPLRGLGVFMLFALSPVRTVRALVLAVLELVYAVGERAASYWNARYRVRWAGAFPLVRVLAHVFLKEMQTFAVMVDMYRGVPSIYTTYNLYDNMAHHFGPVTPPAFRAVRTVDRQIRQIDRMRRRVAPFYDLYVLSDHGQTPAVPFRQLYGQSFGEYVSQLARSAVVAEQADPEAVTRTHVAFLAEELRSAQRGLPPVPARAVGRLSRYVEGAATSPSADQVEVDADVVAMASSGMASLYFNASPRQMDLSEIETLYPRLIDRLVEHPASGLVIGRERGKVVLLGKRGRLIWNGTIAEVEGANPILALDDADWTLEEIARLTCFPRSGDLLIYGSVVNGEGVAFEEQMGVHCAVGGPQAYPFLLSPPGGARAESIRSSRDLYTVFAQYLPGENQVVGEPAMTAVDGARAAL